MMHSKTLIIIHVPCMIITVTVTVNLDSLCQTCARVRVDANPGAEEGQARPTGPGAQANIQEGGAQARRRAETMRQGGKWDSENSRGGTGDDGPRWDSQDSRGGISEAKQRKAMVDRW